MPAPRAVRITEALAALLSAGLVILGIALAVLVVAAPALVGGTGDLSVADGPRLDRVLVQVVVGLVGELLHYRRSRFPSRVRPVIAAAVIVASLGALWWGWWR